MGYQAPPLRTCLRLAPRAHFNCLKRSDRFSYNIYNTQADFFFIIILKASSAMDLSPNTQQRITDAIYTLSEAFRPSARGGRDRGASGSRSIVTGGHESEAASSSRSTAASHYNEAASCSRPRGTTAAGRYSEESASSSRSRVTTAASHYNEAASGSRPRGTTAAGHYSEESASSSRSRVTTAAGHYNEAASGSRPRGTTAAGHYSEESASSSRSKVTAGDGDDEACGSRSGTALIPRFLQGTIFSMLYMGSL